MLCPKHRKMKFPSEMDADDVKQDTEKRYQFFYITFLCSFVYFCHSDYRTSTHLNPCTTPLDARQNLVFCGSDLSTEEKVGIKSCSCYLLELMCVHQGSLPFNPQL